MSQWWSPGPARRADRLADELQAVERVILVPDDEKAAARAGRVSSYPRAAEPGPG